MNELVGFIFARGGSKGLPGKNLRQLGGIPLIGHSIIHARGSKYIGRVIVSTDSPEIMEVAKSYGAEVPFARPSYLSEDDSPEWLAWQHALNFFKETTDKTPPILISIPTTAPLRLSTDIDRCVEEFFKGGSDVVITVSEAHRNPEFNMVKNLPNGLVELVSQPEKNITRRQDAQLVFDMTTVCYVASSEFVLNHSSIFEGRVRAVQIPKHRAIDIDSQYDFKIAEYLLANSESERGAI